MGAGGVSAAVDAGPLIHCGGMLIEVRDPKRSKASWRQEMSAVKRQPKPPRLGPGTMTLLTELNEECQHVLKLSAQLEITGLRETQVEAILGELSAAILHMHEHTRGLDALIDEDHGVG